MPPVRSSISALLDELFEQSPGCAGPIRDRRDALWFPDPSRGFQHALVRSCDVRSEYAELLRDEGCRFGATSWGRRR
jgi:hypothetical protein